MSLSISDLAYAYPDSAELFFEVSFRVGSGEHVGLVGDNGVGKTSLMRVVAGELPATGGRIHLTGDALYMSQHVGFDRGQTVREMLVEYSPPTLRAIGRRLLRAEAELAAGDDTAGMRLGTAITEWSEAGGYELEGRWDQSIRRVLRSDLATIGDRPTSTLSGGENKQLVCDLLFNSDADVLLLDEPDNYLDIPAKLWLEQQICASKKTILVISHDRLLLANAAQKIVTLESSGAWVHGGSYTTYREAREHRQRLLGDHLQRWKDEERRLFRHMKLMKQRAALNDSNAPKADAAETRWERFVDAGPPPAPVPPSHINVRLPGGASARQVLTVRSVGYDDLIRPFSAEVRYGDRIGLVGPNGSGKSHLLRLLQADELTPTTGAVALGNRVSAGMFTQVNDRPEFAGVAVGEIVQRRTGNHEAAMGAMARYGLQDAARRPFETLSGGQKARLEVLYLELEGHNLLLLDEPTDNLDIDSSEILESALATFDGSYVTVSHDRAFLRNPDRWWLLDMDGRLFEFLGYDDAIAAVVTGTVGKNAKLLTDAG